MLAAAFPGYRGLFLLVFTIGWRLQYAIAYKFVLYAF